uniref:Uncharacterized protein n=1 Tax=Arundo donax TaxID=35708 RepID=A0A0A8YYP5_ARUDO
MLEIQFIYLV